MRRTLGILLLVYFLSFSSFFYNNDRLSSIVVNILANDSTVSIQSSPIKETTAVAKSPTVAAVSFEKLQRLYDKLLRLYGPVRDPAPQSREKNIFLSFSNLFYNTFESLWPPNDNNDRLSIPTAGTSRVLLGIRMMRSTPENKRLRVIKKSYLEYHKKTNTTATVCSLQEVVAAKNPEDCQMVYAVVYGGGKGHETDQNKLIHISSGNATVREYRKFLKSNLKSMEAVLLDTSGKLNDYKTIMAWTKWSSQLDEKKFGIFDYTAFSTTGVLIQPPIFWNQNQILKESQENVFGGIEPFDKSKCDSDVPCLNHNFLIFSRDVANVLGSAPKVSQGSESVTTSVWNVLQSNSADSKKLQTVPVNGLIQTDCGVKPEDKPLVDIALWDAYIEKELGFFEKDEVEENLVRENPAEVTSFHGKSRVLLGIFTTNLTEEERERRQVIRDTWVRHYADSTSPNRVCSLQQIQKRQVQEEECQIIYTFVIGAGGSTSPTEKMDTHNINRMVVPKKQIVDREPDVVYLNIKENTNEGKSETWFHYAILASQFNYFDYVGKMDTDTVLIPTRFTDMLNTLPKFPNNVRTILGDPIVQKDSKYHTRGAAYFNGGFYIMSTDLARYITTIDRKKMKHGDKDITIGNYVNSHPKLINRKMLDVHCNRCRVYKRADDYRIFYQALMKTSPPQPHMAYVTNSLLMRYNFTVHVHDSHRYYPEPKDNLFYDKMASLGLERSQKQFRKFLFQEKSLASVFDKRTRFYFNRDSAAFFITKKFAFLHIYKNGGTTVEFMRHSTGERQHQLTNPRIQKRNWLTVVRDPIDRFLSAWAECGYRQKKGMEGFGSLGKLINETYDLRIRAFLKATKRTIGGKGGCARHAYPQANFMMTPNGTIDEHIKAVGDLSELKHMLVGVGHYRFWNDTKQSKNSASENLIKAKHFPSNRSLLSDGTILELCKFLQLDYYLFDYDPPPICIADGGPLEFLN